LNKVKHLAALRGATQCQNSAEDIAAQVTALYEGLLGENKLAEGDILSLIFSMTGDLDEKNPATALRQAGYARDLALFVVQEAQVKNTLERTVRILIHCYLDEGVNPRHVYRNGAELLRQDRSSKGSGEAPISPVMPPFKG
jgi:chorismate mutase